MKQIAFDFSVVPRPTFDNFIVGRNVELVERLRALVRGSERFIYVWGRPGSGRTHLLKSTVGMMQGARSRSVYRPCGTEPFLDTMCDAAEMVAVDDVDALSPPNQHALFNLYNTFRSSGKSVLASGNLPPVQLALREDLATRLAWGLVYEVHALTDTDKIAALDAHAKARGFKLHPDVAAYLLNHVRRDMPALLEILDALDRYSLEVKRAVTVPLVRELLRAQQ